MRPVRGSDSAASLDLPQGSRKTFVRRAVGLVRDRITWVQLDGRRFFDGETEPCINGEILASSSCFGEPAPGRAARGRRLELQGPAEHAIIVPQLSPNRRHSPSISVHSRGLTPR